MFCGTALPDTILISKGGCGCSCLLFSNRILAIKGQTVKKTPMLHLSRINQEGLLQYKKPQYLNFN